MNKIIICSITILFIVFVFVGCLLKPDKVDVQPQKLEVTNIELSIFDSSIQANDKKEYQIPIFKYKEEEKGESASSEDEETTKLAIEWSGKPVQELNVELKKLYLDNQLLSSETYNFNVLGGANQPVLLSNVSLSSGVYQKLRLVLGDNNTIKIDGKVYPLLIPNAQWKGIVLNGPFEVPEDQLFKITINFDVKKSLFYHQNYGFILKPYMNIIDVSIINGMFRGNLSLLGSTNEETVVELNPDRTFRLKNTEYPDHIVSGNYSYSSTLRKILLTNVLVKGPQMGESGKLLVDLRDDITEPIYISITSWGDDSITVRDARFRTQTLYRVADGNFDFSGTISYTNLTVKAKYPDNSKSGSKVAFQITCLDSSVPSQVSSSTIVGNIATKTFKINNGLFINGTLEYEAVAYIYEDTDDVVVAGVTYDKGVGEVLTGSIFSETTYDEHNPSSSYVTVAMDNSNEKILNFPAHFSMNIVMEHDNFTKNNPMIHWKSYPGATKYLVIVLVEDRFDEGDFDDDGNTEWDIAFMDVTPETQIQMFSSNLILNDESGLYHEKFVFNSSEKLCIEVYALNIDGKVNLKTKQGYMYMERITIVKP